jgi:hypothetical protein
VESILAGSDDGLHILAPGEPAVVEMAGHEISALARDGASWWAIAGGQEVWRSEGSGDWSRQATTSDELRLNCLAPSADGLLVGTSQARLLRLDAGTLVPVDSFDRVEERVKWYTPWGGPPDSRSMAMDGGTIYVNVHVGGIIRSRDGGASWEPTIDIDADVHQVIAADGHPGLVLAATAQGLASSDDAGQTWTFHTDGLHGSYCRAVSVAGETLLVSASEGHRGRRAAVYRRALIGPGEPFEKCVQGLPTWFGSNVDSHCLAAAGSVAAFGTEEGAVYRSIDAGETWEPAATGIAAVRCLALA